MKDKYVCCHGAVVSVPDGTVKHETRVRTLLDARLELYGRADEVENIRRAGVLQRLSGVKCHQDHIRKKDIRHVHERKASLLISARSRQWLV